MLCIFAFCDQLKIIKFCARLKSWEFSVSAKQAELGFVQRSNLVWLN